MGKCPLFILFIFASILFFCPQKTYAADADVVINEISSVGNEWIELYNKTDIDITMIGFTIEDNTAEPVKLDSYIVPANGYKVIVGETDFNFGLNDSGDIVTLKFKKDDGSIIIIDKVVFGSWDDGNKLDNAPKPILGESIARIPNGQDTGIDKDDFEIQKEPTPGKKNPDKIINQPPSIPVLNPPIINIQDVNFSWSNSIDPENEPVTYDFYLACDDIFSDGATEKILETADFLSENLAYNDSVCPEYFWKVSATDGPAEVFSEPSSFILVEPVYSNDIIINELLADPLDDETQNEWIELYNNSGEKVDLVGWYLEDIMGSIHKYKITNGVIDAFGYLTFARAQTGITLNNDQEGARLYQPNGNLLFETSVSAKGKEGWGWARNKDGNFVWTTEPTAGGINIILEPLEDAGGTDEEKPVINKIPIKIKTSKVKNYVDMLVEIEGKVVETSGSTFYIDDSSGKAKVYIQAQTKIDKPKMYKGDIFKIFGVVNLYRNVWRVLPRSQDDIKLVKAVKQNLPVVPKVKTVVAKTAVVKKTTSAAPIQARAPTVLEPILKEVKAAEITAPLVLVDQNINLWWAQLAKLLIGLSLVFVVLLVVKIKSFQTVKIVGGHFGDDDT